MAWIMAFVALPHQLLDHVGLECQMVVVGGWHGAKSFLLSERAPRMLVAAVVQARPRSWLVVPAKAEDVHLSLLDL